MKSTGEIFQMSIAPSELRWGVGGEVTEGQRDIFHPPSPTVNQCFQLWNLNHVALCPLKAFLSFTERIILTSKLPVGTIEKLLSCTLQLYGKFLNMKAEAQMSNEVAATCFLYSSPGTSLSDRKVMGEQLSEMSMYNII